MFNLHLTSEQRAIRDTVRDFVRHEIKPIALERERLENFDARFPWEVLEKASRMGLRTLMLSEAAGGAGANNLTACIVIEELAVGDAGLADLVAESQQSPESQTAWQGKDFSLTPGRWSRR